MRTARLLTLLAALAGLAVLAGSAHSATTAPTGLHGFLLRADEPVKTSFSRTPSFAWNPVSGALSYEFQLSLSDAFRDNSIVWADSSLPTPVDAPPITLPWITGDPHALYARVRAITPDGATPWSANFGFDMVPPTAPTPLAGYPGLLRWTPVQGAHGYEVWLIDAHKLEISTTNSLDEREFYTFHQTAAWTGTVRWRIRALRIATGASINGLPAVTYGAWSPIYTSTNPGFGAGPITLVGTVSDIFSNGATSSPAHKLTPGYLWKGNQTIDGKTVELYRMYVFTDKQCLNRVFTSAVVGSQAYSPRPLGPLSLPTTADGVSGARSSYLSDGPEPPGYAYDNASDPIQTSESAADAAPTTATPSAPGAANPPGSTSGSSTTTGAAPGGSGGSPIAQFLAGTKTGAPIDLWDTNWPSSGYYWTVVGVAATAPAAQTTTVGTAGAAKGATLLPVASGAGFNAGDQITVGGENASVTTVAGNTLTLALGLLAGHAAGESVVRTAGNLFYQDLELPQDVCAAGRVMRFGKASEPSLVASGDLFASGLSSDGRLTSGVQNTAFYGQPLVSWTPALGAEEYEVQWSKTQYPFTPELDPVTGSAGKMTASTSVVLPVAPGTWWYRVRGFDYSLPTGAQQMSWSDPVKLVVAKPKFKLVGGTTPVTPSKGGKANSTALKYNAGGVALTLPAGWTKQTVSGSLFAATHGPDTSVAIAKNTGRGTLSLAQWSQALVADAKNKGAIDLQSTTVKEPGGTAVYLSFQWTNKAGKKHSMHEYFFDAGSASYALVLDTTTSLDPSFRSAFTRIAASFRHP